MTRYLLTFLAFSSLLAYGQQTKVYGTVNDALTGIPLPFVRVQFVDTKIGTLTNDLGQFSLETYYASDSVQFSMSGYVTVRKKVVKDKEQEINVQLAIPSTDFEEVVVRPPDEFPSTVLHKKVIANKDINNKEKLLSYEYEVYSKMQLDLNNLGDKFTDIGLVKKLDLVMSYLDSAENGKNYLPMLLSETVSHYYFKNNPKKKKEVIAGTYVS
jgi:hypothetical protein